MLVHGAGTGGWLWEDVAEAALERGWTVRELPTGHFSMVTAPAALADLVQG